MDILGAVLMMKHEPKGLSFFSGFPEKKPQILKNNLVFSLALKKFDRLKIQGFLWQGRFEMEQSCPICFKTGRKDNIARHIATHKRQVVDLMSPFNLKVCLEKRMPLFYIIDKLAYCFICGKNAAKDKIKHFVDYYPIHHKQCCDQFDAVKSFYIPPEKPQLNVLVHDDSPPPPPANVIICDESLKARVAELEAEVQKLKDEVKESDATAADYKADFKTEQKRLKKALDTIDRLNNLVVVVLNDEQKLNNSDLLKTVDKLIGEEWSDDEDE